MQIQMKRRTFIRMISFIVAAFAVLGIYAALTTGRERSYEIQVTSLYRESMADLSDALSELDHDLQKSAYAVTPYQSVLLATDIWQKSAQAKSALDRLPVSSSVQANLSKFLAQTGDYAFMMARKIVAEDDVTDDERGNMQLLANRANELSVFMTNLQAQVLDMNASSDEMAAVIENSVAFSESSVSALAQQDEQSQEEVQSLPTLIYDGPFSDSVFNKESVFLVDKGSVTDDDAKMRAAYILDITPDVLELKTKVDAVSMRTLYFQGGGNDIYITEKGGYCHSFHKTREVSENNISVEDAIWNAQQFLDKIGYPNMADTYYYIENNIVTINFAYLENGIVCYPDLIKVGVALDNGDIIFLDAAAYLTNHTSRSLNVTFSHDDAIKQISSSLQVESDQYAVIPTSGGYEQFCYEFKATAQDGTQLLIYINAQTGREEKFLILLIDDNGTLTV